MSLYSRIRFEFASKTPPRQKFALNLPPEIFWSHKLYFSVYWKIMMANFGWLLLPKNENFRKFSYLMDLIDKIFRKRQWFPYLSTFFCRTVFSCSFLGEGVWGRGKKICFKKFWKPFNKNAIIMYLVYKL